MFRAYGARALFAFGAPALTGWANFCRAYGAEVLKVCHCSAIPPVELRHSTDEFMSARLAAMKSLLFRALNIALFATSFATAQFSTAQLAKAQEVIPLYNGTPPGSTAENYPEKAYFSKAWNTDVVSNVTKPTLTVFKPAAGTANGTAIVVCPGGGFMALSINSEGIDVAKYLATKGVTAFVLKYRLAHTGEDATQEFMDLYTSNRPKFAELVKPVVPLSIADGLAAVTYVRKHAAEFGVSPERVGIIGFSAGGSVTMGVGTQYTAESRPAFLAPIYAGGSRFKDAPVPADAPPMFVLAATDDNLGLAPDSVMLYEKWTAAHKPAELHMYEKGGHGFGMRQHGIPTDRWIERFVDWLELEGFLKK
jgi:acetyl esterase/lipase